MFKPILFCQFRLEWFDIRMGYCMLQNFPFRMMDTQYRMHPTIAEFPAKHIYDGALKSDVDPKTRIPPTGFDWPDRKRPVAFVGEIKCLLNLISMCRIYFGYIFGYDTFSIDMRNWVWSCIWDVCRMHDRVLCYKCTHIHDVQGVRELDWLSCTYAIPQNKSA